MAAAATTAEAVTRARTLPSSTATAETVAAAEAAAIVAAAVVVVAIAACSWPAAGCSAAHSGSGTAHRCRCLRCRCRCWSPRSAAGASAGGLVAGSRAQSRCPHVKVGALHAGAAKACILCTPTGSATKPFLVPRCCERDARAACALCARCVRAPLLTRLGGRPPRWAREASLFKAFASYESVDVGRERQQAQWQAAGPRQGSEASRCCERETEPLPFVRAGEAKCVSRIGGYSKMGCYSCAGVLGGFELSRARSAAGPEEARDAAPGTRLGAAIESERLGAALAAGLGRLQAFALLPPPLPPLLVHIRSRTAFNITRPPRPRPLQCPPAACR